MPIVDLSTATPTEQFWLGLTIEASMDEPFGLRATLGLGIALVPPTLSNDTVFEIDPIEFGVDFDEEIIVPAILDLQGIFQFGVDLAASSRGFSEVEVDELLLTLHIYPVVSFPANYQEFKTRFSINGVEVPITTFQIKAAPNKIGTDVSVTLADNSDRALVDSFSVYKLEVATVISGVTTWYTLAEGRLTTDTLSIGWDKNAPTDSVSLNKEAGY
jgi:hypothetical protein